MSTGPTQQLVTFVANLRYEDIPNRVRERAADIFLDALASALAGQQIARVRVQLSPSDYQMHADQGWDGRFQAMLSARFVAAVVLHSRRCWLDQFGPEWLREPAVNAFARDRVVVEPSPEVPDAGVAVEMTLQDGRRYVDTRAFPRGDAADPLTRGEIEDKLRVAAAGQLPDETTASLIQGLDRLEDVASVRGLLQLLRAREYASG